LVTYSGAMLATGARNRESGCLRLGWVIATIALLLAGAGPSDAAASTGWRAPRLAWKPCSGFPTMQCSTLSVPLDWSRPGGARISLALTRLRATGPGRRLGTVLFNCGGPGCASAEQMKQAPGIFTHRLRERFDIVGFDPRDTGQSTLVQCEQPRGPDPSIPFHDFPQRKAGYFRLLKFNRALARSCQGAYLMHVGAVDAVRDIDGIRQALRDGKLNWLGFSYGTMLGAEYAERYPHHIRAMVLDGALDRSLSEPVMLADEARAAEDEFSRWADWCTTTTECGLQGRPVRALWSRLIADANRPPSHGLTGTELQFLADDQFLLFKDGNPFVGASPWSVFGKDVATLLQGANSGGLSNNSFPGARAIECLDWPVQARGYSGFAARLALARKIAPLLGGDVQTMRIISDCVGWPRPRATPRHDLHVRGAPPILIVNANYDPSTAYPWALNLHAQIPRSVLLTRIGDGHTSYFTSPCAQRAIDRYLIDLAPPRDGAVCRDS
jgi:pimeloyl-ACP methyl ester carboxylesterase